MSRKNIKIQISKRFLEACDAIIIEKDYKSDAQFAKHLDIHPQVFSDFRTGKANAGVDYISVLLTKFPEIDANWILTGINKKEPDKPDEPDIEKLIEKKVAEALAKQKERASVLK